MIKWGMDIKEALKRIKVEFERAITTSVFNDKLYDDGNRAKEALIRSQRLINYIHESIKVEFINCGVNPDKIFPRLNSTKPEIIIRGFLKPKRQDICIVPNPLAIRDQSQTEKVITVNIRSQLSSLNKNFDTLYERTFAEPLNLHLENPKQCLGEVYLIPTHEYDDGAMVDNRVEFKSVSRIEHYIQMFQALNKRIDYERDEYKYERVCLLIADFRQESPKLYSDIQELINDGLISRSTQVTLDNLTYDNFASDLLDTYSRRFNIRELY